MKREWSHRDSAPVFYIFAKIPDDEAEIDNCVGTGSYFFIVLLHYNYQNAKISPITIEEASGAAAAVKVGGHQVKGKQVKDLYDLVTVSREYKAMRKRAVTEKME